MTTCKIAGIDVHKKMLMVVAGELSEDGGLKFEKRKFGTTSAELRHVSAWLGAHGVSEAVMESTAQYWAPVWRELKPRLKLHLAPAHSNRAPKGRKDDDRDAQRLVRRFIAGELFLSFVPEDEQQGWRTLTRGRLQLVRDRSRTLGQIEALMEQTGIKLSSVVSDLWGASGQKILRAIAGGQSDPAALAELADRRVKATPEELTEALTGRPAGAHTFMLKQHLERLDVLERQIAAIGRETGAAMQTYQQAILRLVQIPGIRVEAAQQIVAEVGPSAAAFSCAEKLASWGGVCPGRNQSGGVDHSSHSPKGNPCFRRILAEAAQAAVRTKGSYFELLFHRFIGRMGYVKAVWVIAHRICKLIWRILNQGVEYIEHGDLISKTGKIRRIQRLAKELRLAGYTVTAPTPAGTSA